MRDTQRGRDIGRGRSRLHAGSPMWDSIPDSRITSRAEGRCQTAEPPRDPPAHIFFKRFYSPIHKRHTERQRHRQREKQAPCRELDVGLDPRTPGSHPEPKADAQLLSHPGAPIRSLFKTKQNKNPMAKHTLQFF